MISGIKGSSISRVVSPFRLLCVFLSVVLTLGVIIGLRNADVAYADETLYSGTCGTCAWDISSDGTLSVHPGTLALGGYDSFPWAQYDSSIKKARFVQEGSKKVVANADSSYLLSLRFLESVDLSGLDTSNVTDMSHMFESCLSLKSLDLSNLDTSKVVNMSKMFNNCISLESLDVSGFDTSNVTDMAYMFGGFSRLQSLDVSNFDTSNVTDMSWMFAGCPLLSSLRFGEQWEFPSDDWFIYTEGLWRGPNGELLTSAQLANTYQGAIMAGLWTRFLAGECGTCSWEISPDGTLSVHPGVLAPGGQGEGSWKQYSGSIKKVRFVQEGSQKVVPDANASGLLADLVALELVDLSGLDTSNVTDMSHMFESCISLKSLDLSNLDTSKVTNMSDMFNNCVDLISLNLSRFDTSNVIDMRHMFQRCIYLESLDLSSFDTSNVTDMGYMFDDCSSLRTIFVGPCWSTDKVGNNEWMFSGCTALVGGNGTVYDSSHVDVEYARIDAPGTPGYLTLKSSQTDISKATVSAIANQTYTGKALTPKPTVTWNGKTLVEGADYTLSYKNNTNIGTATITITGKGNFTGTKSATFTITAAPTPTPVDTKPLADSIKAASDDVAGTQVSKDGSDVSRTAFWVPASAEKRLSDALVSARKVLSDSSSTQAQVNAALKALSEAKAAYDAAKKPGTAKVWERLAGQNAYGTMQAVVSEGWDSASTVVIATFDGYWDALSASALAGKNDAPILLTGKDELHKTTAAEIKRLGAKRAIIVGGTAAVSSSVESKIKAMGLTTERYWGQNAQQTAVAISTKVGSAAGTCIIATSDGYWDALAASPLAYAKGYPIYLTDATGVLKAETLVALKKAGFKRAIIAGGSAAVASRTESDLKGIGIGKVERKWGATAIQTSRALAEFAISEGLSANHMGVATLDGYWDALTGGAMLGKKGGVLVLASVQNTSNASLCASNSGVIGRAYILGGEAALSKAVFDAYDQATRKALSTNKSSSVKANGAPNFERKSATL